MVSQKLKEFMIIKEMREFIDAFYKLLSWLEAKPQIHPGGCPYARNLIQTMLDCHDRLVVKFCISYDEEMVDKLIAMLNDVPPDYDPPMAGLFLCKICKWVVSYLPKMPIWVCKVARVATSKHIFWFFYYFYLFLFELSKQFINRFFTWFIMSYSKSPKTATLFIYLGIFR